MSEQYAEVGGISLTFDYFRPDTDEQLPLVVCLHGGGWISGDSTHMHDVARSLNRNGFAAACPNYRLAPLHPFPAAVEDAQAFVRFVRENAEQLKILPDAIASLGNSAGGHLSAMIALTDNQADTPHHSRTNAAICICPITDITKPRENHYEISWSFVDQFMGGVPYEANERYYEQASPVYHVTKEAPPICLIHGSADDIVPPSQSEELYQALKAQGTQVEMHFAPDEGHSFTLQSWLEIEKAFTKFLEQELKVNV